MRGKAVFVIMVFILMATISYFGCSKDEDIPLKREGNVPDVSTMTAEEIFAVKVSDMLQPLNAATDIDMENPPDDEGFRTLSSVMDMIRQGDTIETLAATVTGVDIQGPFNVVPGDIPNDKFQELVKDVPAGGFSKMQEITDVGFGVIYIPAIKDDGTIDIGVLLVPTGMPLSMNTIVPGAVSDAGGTTTVTTPGK